jgi:hypothetical protein
MEKISARGMPFNLEMAINNALQKQVNTSSDSHKISELHFEFNFEKSRGKLPNKFNVLILWEPESVMPWQYKRSVLNKFDLIIPMSPWRAINLGIAHWAFHPSKIESISIDENLRNKNIVMVNAAKFSGSNKSFYGLRRKISKKLQSMNIGYELYGQNWHMKKSKELRERIWAVRKELLALNFPSLLEAFSEITYGYPEFLGPLDDKLSKLSEYRYSLVIENDPDWITEKLFDALSAKCVPIYIGPNLSRFKLLSKCVIQLEPSVKAIEQFFISDNIDLYNLKKAAVDDFASYSEDLKLFALESVSDEISSIVKNHYLTL